MSKLTAWVQSHRKPVMAGGAAAAVGLGLWVRRRKAAGKPALSILPSTATSAPGAAGTVIAPATYDSTSSDLYNSIEPMIEALQHSVDQLQQNVSNPASSLPVTPASAPPATSTPATPAPAAAVVASPSASVNITSPASPVAPVIDDTTIAALGGWGGNDPSVNPRVSPAAPVTVTAGTQLPPTLGMGQRYQYTETNGQVFGFVAG